jgi:hypothetical protein
MPSYYNLSETEFRAWYNNWSTVAAANSVALGLSPGDVSAINGARTTYTNAVASYVTAHDAARAATESKNEAYAAAFDLVQRWSNQWQANPGISDGLKLSLGLYIRDTTPSPRPIFPISQLSGSGNSVGTVKLRWNRNGNLPGCTFIVQSRPVGGTWTFLAVTTKTRLSIMNQGLTPTEFRVLTERRGILSEPSDAIVVYGDGGESTTLHLMEEAA